MPDATESKVVTVDGVEPSILVKLLDTKENPGRVKIYNDDDGGDRFLVKGETTLVTPQDLSAVGTVEVEIINDKDDDEVTITPSDSNSVDETVVVAPTEPAAKPAVVINSSPINSPGQPGQ